MSGNVIKIYEGEFQMKRKLIILTFLCLLLSLLVACSSSGIVDEYDPTPGENTTEESIVYSSKRKIIYNVSASLYIEANFKEEIASLKASINEDEWSDSENISETSAHFIFRIKTTRLDDFVASLSTYGEVKNLNKKATDISLQYQDSSNQIIAFEAEKSRLIELYDGANMSEIIQINTRISQIDKELRVLKGDIIQYDSLLEYSEVQLSIYNEAPEEDDKSYGQKIGQAFKMGINALVKFLEFFSLVIVTIFPFALVLAAVGVGIYFLRKVYLNKKTSKHDKSKEKPLE
jgi:hypothetical protein